jgi:hypothetical protein
VREIPALEALSRAPGRRVVALCVDAPRDRAAAARLLADRGATYPAYYLSPEDADNEGGLDELVDLLRLSIPTVIAVSSEGRIEAVLRGAPQGD